MSINSRQKYIKSPLNYIGGKHKILPDILPYFPDKISSFVDLFAGGFNVGINIDAEKIICNDYIPYVIEMYKYFTETNEDELLSQIYHRIKHYDLSDKNEKGYMSLREEYNTTRKSIDLFMLTCYSFNHQIRFNSKHQFNNPFGKNRSSYNKNIENNLLRFVRALKRKNIEFRTIDFAEFNIENLNENAFVYCDPPYLITTGSYNDGKRGFKGWTIKEEVELLNLLKRLDQNKVKFALSNVIHHKGETNNILLEWANAYHVNYIAKGYSNCNYQFKLKNEKTIEVLVTNYSKGIEKWELAKILHKGFR